MAAQPLPLAYAKLTFRSFLYVLYCFEGGLALLVVPWSPLWKENFYFERFSVLKEIGLHPVFRGSVSGIGFALLVEGIIGFLRFAFGRAPQGERRLPGGRREPVPAAPRSTEPGPATSRRPEAHPASAPAPDAFEGDR